MRSSVLLIQVTAAVSLFEKTAKSGGDADVRAFAGKTLPALQQRAKTSEAAVQGARKSR